MKYNPHRTTAHSLQAELSKVQRQHFALQCVLEQHQAFPEQEKREEMANLAQRKIELLAEKNSVKNSLTVAQEQLDDTSIIRRLKRQGIFAHYLVNHIRASMDAVGIRARIRKLNSELVSFDPAISVIDEQLAHVKEELDAHLSENTDSVTTQLEVLQQEIDRLSQQLESEQLLADSFDEMLGTLGEQAEKTYKQVTLLKQDIARAEELVDALNTESKRDRAIAHRECEREFGTGKPQQVLRQKRLELDAKVRDLNKLERRIAEEIRRKSLNVQKLIIDGSNLCYEGEQFIGLFALRELISHIKDKYEIAVLFDSSTVSKLGLRNKSELRLPLPAQNIHIVSNRQGADEMILDLASEPTTYVVSNDRFRDYQVDKSAVQEERLIQFEIFSGKITVPDLQLSLEFSNQNT